jgi:hypothetical protein
MVDIFGEEQRTVFLLRQELDSWKGEVCTASRVTPPEVKQRYIAQMTKRYRKN